MSGWTLLLNLTVKSTLVLLAAWMVAALLRRHSAAARHMVWSTAFAILLAIPALTLLLPAWPNRLANGLLRSEPGITFRTMTIAAQGAGASVEQGVATQSTKPSTRAGGVPFDVRGMVLFVYGLGVIGAVAKLARDYWSLARIRGALPVSQYRAEQFGIVEPVDLLETESGMPMAAGVLRPAILLPAESEEWDWERVRLVVLHEYAHISRGDAASQLLARAALCVMWFHPLAWAAWREFLKERERAADDVVLRNGARPSEYAGHLVEIARSYQTAPLGATAGIAMARLSQLEGRVSAILDSNVKRGVTGRKAVVASLLAALIAAVPLATVRAQSQAEQQPPPQVETVIATANAQKNHELLEQAAGAYEKLRKFPEAQQLREAALAIRKLGGNAQYAEGLIRLAELAQKRNASAEAAEYYRRAVELGDMPETYPALVNLGLSAAFADRNVEQGRDYLERARNVAKSGNQMARAMTWLAFLQDRDAARAGETEELYRTAMSLADGGSQEQALATEMLARFLRNGGRDGEAEALEQRAKLMRKNLAQALSPVFGHVAAPGPVKVGNGVSAPKLIYKLEPSYSEEARASKLSGTVLLKVVIDVDGRAKDIEVSKSLGLGLDEKAVEAVSAWRFKPGELQGGALVPVMATIEINFKLL